MALIDLERAVLSVCFKAEPPADQLAKLGRRDVWLLYRELARDRLWREIKLALPRTCASLEPELLARSFAEHLDRDPPRTRYFHAIVQAFADSAQRSWRRETSLPAGALDLLRYEAALWRVSDLEARVPDDLGEFEFDRIPVLSTALSLLELEHAVHSPGRDGPYGASGRVYLAIHRASHAHKPRTWTFNRTSHALLREFERGQLSASQAVTAVAKRLRRRVDAAFVDGLCASLAQWIEIGILLGSRPMGASP